MTDIAHRFSVFSPLARALRRAPGSLRLFACALLASCALNALAACPLEAPRLRVTDTGNVLGAKASAVADKLAGYQVATGHQVVVLVVPSLGADTSIEECAVTVFKQWRLGGKGIDDGVLLLVGVKERKMRIEVGYGLEGTLTDAQSSRIIHEVMGPMFARGEYADGLDRGLDAIMAVIGASNSAPRAELPHSNADDANNEMIGKCVVLFLGIVVLLVSTLAGIVGLLGFGIPIIGLTFFSCQDWRGYLFAGAYVLIWCGLRLWLIRANVRKYHLKKSRNNALIWLACFLAIGTAAPVRKPRTRAPKGKGASSGYNFSYGIGSSGDSGGSSSDTSFSSNSSSDSGGASGGGGASGDW